MWNRASAAATTVAEPVVEACPPEIAKDSATTGSVLAVSPSEAGSPRSRASGTTSTAKMVADAKSAVEARPSGIAKQGATESVFAGSSGEAGSSGSRADGSTSRSSSRKVWW